MYWKNSMLDDHLIFSRRESMMEEGFQSTSEGLTENFRRSYACTDKSIEVCLNEKLDSFLKWLNKNADT